MLNQKGNITIIVGFILATIILLVLILFFWITGIRPFAKQTMEISLGPVPDELLASLDHKTSTPAAIPSSNETASSTSQVWESKIYKAKEVCGEIVPYKKLADNYENAFKVLQEEKKEEFTRSCPGKPCLEADLKSTKSAQVFDKKGQPLSETLYLIEVIDKKTEISQYFWEAIDESGVLYHISWCSD